MPVIMVKLVADTPELDHGDTDARPNPEPSARRIRESEAAPKAPPRIAGQEIPEEDASRVLRASPACITSARFTESASNAMFVSLRQCQNSMSRMMIGIGTPSNQRRIPRPICYLPLQQGTRALMSNHVREIISNGTSPTCHTV
jgi:hypothetical protein